MEGVVRVDSGWCELEIGMQLLALNVFMSIYMIYLQYQQSFKADFALLIKSWLLETLDRDMRFRSLCHYMLIFSRDIALYISPDYFPYCHVLFSKNLRK